MIWHMLKNDQCLNNENPVVQTLSQTSYITLPEPKRGDVVALVRRLRYRDGRNQVEIVYGKVKTYGTKHSHLDGFGKFSYIGRVEIAQTPMFVCGKVEQEIVEKHARFYAEATYKHDMRQAIERHAAATQRIKDLEELDGYDVAIQDAPK